MGRAGRELGGERGGAIGREQERPAPRGPQTGVKYPGGGATPPTRARPAPRSPELAERGEVVLLLLLTVVAKFGGFLGETVPLPN